MGNNEDENATYPGQGGMGEAYANLRKMEAADKKTPVVNVNELTPAETERLAILAEEMGEVIQVIGKIIRHGYDSRNPLDKKSKSNRVNLELELGDVISAINRMVRENDVDGDDIESRSIVKDIKIKQWLHHQDDED